MSTTEMMQTVETAPAGLQKLGAPTATAPKGSNKVVFRAAAKSAEFFDHLRAHYRETRRTHVEIPCDIKILALDGSLFDTGTATVRDVSPSGALLGSLKLSKGCFPACGFKVVMTLKSDDYKGIGIEASPVRIVTESAGLGVKFDEIFVTV
ncbi:MAG TPA: hypothetical protein VEK08_20600 [Planctomycetota bacterium]|nr:hypothetical protein [Planctomycetota bacterium]